MDDLLAHKAPPVAEWLAHPKRARWHLHFTPTSSSWLNLVEGWFKLLTERRLRRGTFNSVDQLVDAIDQWIEHWNHDPHPYIQKKPAEDILAKVQRGRAALSSQIKSVTDHQPRQCPQLRTGACSGKDHHVESPEATAMYTRIRAENASCTWCMNAVRDELLARPLVHHVEMSAMAGCWEVDHDHDDVSALIALLRQSVHGWQVADNGEIVAVKTGPTVSGECVWYPSRHPADR